MSLPLLLRPNGRFISLDPDGSGMLLDVILATAQ
jgi:hypothetical protein